MIWFVIILFAFMLMANFGAIIDSIFHPEIEYFDSEHILVGIISAFIVGSMLVLLIVYSERLKKALNDISQGEEKKRQSEDQYQALLQTAIDGFWLVDVNGKLLQVNEAYCRMSGYTEQELLSKRITDLESVETADATASHIQTIITKGEDRFESQHRRKDGSFFDVEVSVQFKDIEGGRFVAFLRDITERKRSEELLKESEFKYRALIEKSNDSIFCVDKKGYYQFVNNVFASTFGKTPEYFYGKSFWDIYSKEQADMRFAASSKVFETGKAGSVDVEVPLPDRILYFIAKTNPITDSQGNVILNLTIATDITERKKAEEELRESEDKYRGVVENSPNAIAIYVDGKIVFVNNECVRLMGSKNKEELIGKSVMQFVHPDNRAMVIERMKQVAIEGKPLPTTEEKFNRLDGTSVEVEVRAIPTKYKEKPAVQLIVQDVTERKRAENLIRESEEKYRLLYESNQMPIAIFDAETLKFLSVNNAFVHKYGYTREEFSTMTILEIRPDTEIERVKQSVKMIDKGLVNLGEYLHKKKNGEIIRVEIIRHDLIYAGKNAKLVFANDITERKCVEEELRKSKEDFQSYFEMGSMGMCITSPEKGWIEVNDRLCQMLGYNKNELSQLNWAELTHPDDLNADLELFNEVVEGKRNSYELDKRFIRKDGNIVCTVLSVTCQRKLDGTVDHFLASLLDITERKSVEQALAVSTNQLERISEVAKVGGWELDLTTMQMSFSKESLRINEIDPNSQITLELAMNMISPKARPIMQTAVQAAIDNGLPFDLELPLITAKGKYIWTHTKGFAVMAGDKAVKLFGIFQDITERKQAEEKLTLTRMSVESASDSLFWIKPNSKIVEVNEAACRLLGYTREELLQMSVPEVDAHYNAEVWEQHFPELRKNGTLKFESVQRTKDGRLIQVEIVANYIQRGDEEYNCAFVRDITERKNTEQALRNAQKLESIGTLAGGIAHDFNNLLNAIMGQSSLALTKLSEDNPAVSNITKAIKASERATDLTRQLLAYSGKGKFFTEEIDLNQLIRENISLLEVSISKTTELHYELGTPSPCIYGDIGQIQQVIMNLIINASDAMETKSGVITVYTSKIDLTEKDNKYWKYTNAPLVSGSYAMLQVKDTGSGISQETLTRIFDPFFTTKFTGRGLGLSAVLGIIKGHKGGLHIESEIGKGTMFEIIWPLVGTSTKTDIPEKKEKLNIDGEGKTILIIDDDPFVFQLLEDILSDVNFKVIGALDPLKGIEIYRRDYQNILMVILDYSMPHMTGYDAFEKLKLINKDIKVILSSGYTEEETLSNFGKERPTGFFQKPYKPDALVQRVAEIVSNKS